MELHGSYCRAHIANTALQGPYCKDGIARSRSRGEVEAEGRRQLGKYQRLPHSKSQHTIVDCTADYKWLQYRRQWRDKRTNCSSLEIVCGEELGKSAGILHLQEAERSACVRGRGMLERGREGAARQKCSFFYLQLMMSRAGSSSTSSLNRPGLGHWLGPGLGLGLGLQFLLTVVLVVD